MKRYVPQVLLLAICAIGAAATMVGCDDQAQASDNLLTNPGAMKYAANAVHAYFTPVDMSDETSPVREMHPEYQLQDPTKEQMVPFHEKIPEHTRSWWMVHDGTFTNYKDRDGVVWKHIPDGAWASYYSPTGTGPGPGTQFHDVRGPTATTWRERWHITWGPNISSYYNPSPGVDSLWVHIPSGEDASLYKPYGTSHIPSGPNASLYAVPTPVEDPPTDGTN